ncbi:glucosaminidase domain-containing protein [Pedobacter sp. SD-b]|uniref:Glucosaminidase domain-containing protein n=1 Tax=Pedobacter segetis TaxID=2793069 RepID=A0ABS1BKX6_9SPHI|nr:glucosaminidase domain-containing protein [Pedobacter segetis]MBK0383527.1 glucosaminidase domain-containing protein [Pedobacter segetis]
MGKKIQYKGSSTPGKNTPGQYASKIASAVIKACLNTGILPSVVIGQAMQESLYGNNYKAYYFNNPFGHMANSNWSGDSVRLGTGKAPYWRAYPTLLDAFKSHVAILQGNKYKIQGVALKKTPIAQLDSLQKAGYNVGPDRNQYAAKINRIINQYQLPGYDKQLLAMERELNDNNLAFHEQDGITQALHSIFA